MKKISELMLLLTGVLSFALLCESAFSYLTRKMFLDFDSQNLLLWNYASRIGVLPYKDIFFPYGIFFYYLNGSLFFNFLFLAFLTIFAVCIFFLFKNIQKSLFVAISSLAIVLLSVFWLSGSYSVIRYGFFLLIVCFTFLQVGRSNNSKTYTYIGVATGLVISLFLDQGLYAFGVVLVTILFNDYLINKKKINKHLFRNLLHYLSGLSVGIIPLLVFLYISDSFMPFINSFANLSEITSYAKTPFLHSLRNFPGIFNVGVLFISSCVIGYRMLYKREKLTSDIKLLSGALVVLLILEQKSIIRSIDEQIFYVAVVVLLLIINPLLANIKYKFALSLLLLITLLVSVILFRPNSYQEFNSKKYLNVLTKTNGDIFSIPSDPVFYILNNQLPPYFSNIYDSSSITSQKKQISYIKARDIESIIFNLKRKSIQDGVPDYIRTPRIYSYIFKNYGNIEYIFGDFIIISKGGDFFKSEKFKNSKELSDYFLDVNFGKVPASEGRYKSGYIKNAKYFKNQNELNLFLNKNDIYSKDTYIVIYPDGKTNTNTILVNETKVTFDMCEEQYPCIVNISNLPLFYKNRKIDKIFVRNFKSVGLFLTSNNIFW